MSTRDAGAPGAAFAGRGGACAAGAAGFPDGDTVVLGEEQRDAAAFDRCKADTAQKSTLAFRFHVKPFGERFEVISSSAIASPQPLERLLSVDERANRALAVSNLAFVMIPEPLPKTVKPRKV
jgi:hypothetical protein